MSETDSFIEEVTEEVRRDKLFGLIRKYGWIAITVVVVIVGGAAFREYQAAQTRQAAQDFGTQVLQAMEQNAPADRISDLQTITAPTPTAQAVVDLLIAAELVSDDQAEQAVTRLEQVATNAQADEIYRNIAQYKRLSRDDAGLSPEDRKFGLQSMAVAGNPLRLMAQEQLALIDLEQGDADAAVSKFQAILQDAELTQGLRQRTTQVLIALGQDPQDSIQ